MLMEKVSVTLPNPLSFLLHEMHGPVGVPRTIPLYTHGPGISNRATPTPAPFGEVMWSLELYSLPRPPWYSLLSSTLKSQGRILALEDAELLTTFQVFHVSVVETRQTSEPRWPRSDFRLWFWIALRVQAIPQMALRFGTCSPWFDRANGKGQKRSKCLVHSRCSINSTLSSENGTPGNYGWSVSQFLYSKFNSFGFSW